LSIFYLLEHPSTALALLKAISSVAVFSSSAEEDDASQTSVASSASTSTRPSEHLDLCLGPYKAMLACKNQDERFRSLSISMQQVLFSNAHTEVI
jgi:hypothetical protein